MDSAKSQAFEVSCWASVNLRCAEEVYKSVMSKAKWFVVRKPSTQTYKKFCHQTPLSSCSVEGGSGDETSLSQESAGLNLSEFHTSNLNSTCDPLQILCCNGNVPSTSTSMCSCVSS